MLLYPGESIIQEKGQLVAGLFGSRKKKSNGDLTEQNLTFLTLLSQPSIDILANKILVYCQNESHS